jgi:hypothetical protein
MHLTRKTSHLRPGDNEQLFPSDAVKRGSSSAHVEKVHKINMRMIKHLCSVDGTTKQDPTKFFNELLTTKGKGGTGAILRCGGCT